MAAQMTREESKAGALPQTPPKAMPLETNYFQKMGSRGIAPGGARGGAPVFLLPDRRR
jgi:hypothetical protein